MKISKAVEKMKPSGIREFFDLVIGMKDVISLGVGEPDFVTPWNICESAMFSLEKGYTRAADVLVILGKNQVDPEKQKRNQESFHGKRDCGIKILLT